MIKEFLEKYNYLERELRDVGVNVSQLQVHVDEETVGESVEDQVSTAISTFRIHLRGNFITEKRFLSWFQLFLSELRLLFQYVLL